MNIGTNIGTNLSALARFLIAAGVGLGAFGAHGLKNRLTPDMLAVFEVGVRYQLYHALGLVALGAGLLFVTGTVVFSGSLHLLGWSAEMRAGANVRAPGGCAAQ